MENIMNYYETLVPFLGQVLGEHCEVVLQDCKNGGIRAIANNHVSGRTLGSPLTDFAKNKMEDKSWKHSDFLCNYEGRTHDGKLLRSSTLFITDKSKQELLGMLCINIQTEDYQHAAEVLLKLGGLTFSGIHLKSTDVPDTMYIQENFVDSMSVVINDTLSQIYGDNIPSSYTPEERLSIITQLDQRGVFQVKGAVSRVARVLHCSDSSMYRYLSNLHIRE